MKTPRDDEKEFRIRPPQKPRGSKRTNDVKVWANAFRRVGRYIQMGRRAARSLAAAGRSQGRGLGGTKSHLQRCSVRITYAKNKSQGQWKAHARYIQRESATTTLDGGKGTGFNQTENGVNLPSVVDRWQKAGDERLFKLIVSPEFGNEIDLQRHTRELMARMEKDLGTRLEWVAAAHFNTDHPHVHIILRGVNDQGQALRLDKSYIKSGVRNHAQELATNQIGYRSEGQVIEAQKREVAHHRFTSLDQIISRQQRPKDTQLFQIQLQTPTHAMVLDDAQDERARLVAARLRTLQTMGLATKVNAETWEVRRDFEQVLRSMQKAQDRQKLLARHGTLSSDQRLPVQLTSVRDFRRLEGRVLVHDEEDSGRAYMLLEGTDAKIHMIYHDAAISEARAAGKMQPDNFVVLRKKFINNQFVLEIEDMGDSGGMLSNRQWLRSAARWQVRNGNTPGPPQGWGGWLGQYQAAVHQSVQAELLQAAQDKRGR